MIFILDWYVDSVSGIDYAFLAPDLKICRILNGMWQVSGAHGPIDSDLAVDSMVSYHDLGFTSWDMADIYGPAESIFGRFRRKIAARNDDHLSQITALTKFVPNPGPMTKSVVEDAVDKSLAKMNVSAIDAIQFHWWDYGDERYLDAMRHLSDLQDGGKIRHIALTNFDTIRMRIMSENGFKFVSNQVQYSIIDQRPLVHMTEFCRKHHVGLLTYGTLAGGLLSEKYLRQPEPTRADLHTASLQKYKNMVDAWGGWGLFQKLLAVLDDVAKKHHTKIPAVATRYILDKPCVSGVIIGARLGVSDHAHENLAAFDLTLDSDDFGRIDEFSSTCNDLYGMIGDCGDEYR